MKATDIVNKVELDVTYDSLIELMRAGRQVDFVLPAPETDGDGYLTRSTVVYCVTLPPTTSTTCRTILNRKKQHRFASANHSVFFRPTDRNSYKSCSCFLSFKDLFTKTPPII